MEIIAAFWLSLVYTRIGRMDNLSALSAALGSGNVTVKFELAGNY